MRILMVENSNNTLANICHDFGGNLGKTTEDSGQIKAEKG